MYTEKTRLFELLLWEETKRGEFWNVRNWCFYNQVSPIASMGTGIFTYMKTIKINQTYNQMFVNIPYGYVDRTGNEYNKSQ